MTYVNPKTNARSGSTTWTSRPDRISPAARRATSTAARRASFRGVARRNPQEPLTLRVRYRGGSEAWVLVEGRERVQAFPGHMSIYDVVQMVNGRNHQGG